LKHYDPDKKSIDEVYDNRLDSYSHDLFLKLRDNQMKRNKAEWESRDVREKAKNLTYFRTAYLGEGNRLDPIPPDHVMRTWDWYHEVDKALCAKKPDGKPKYRFIMILVPPGWGKSHGYTIPYPIQTLCLDRNKKVLILSKSANRAKTFMGAMARALKNFQKIQRDFGGEFYSSENVWNTENLKVKGSLDMEATYSIANQGFYSQIEGARPDLIICDDPLDLETAVSKKGVERFLNTFMSTVEARLEPGGQLLLITHRFTMNDGLDELLESNYFKEEYGGIAFVIPAIDQDGFSTCPKRWDQDEIELMKIRKGRTVWQTEYMQNPVSRGDAPFLYEWIAPPDPEVTALKDRNKDKWVDIMPREVYLSIDPAYSIDEKSDYTGMVALGPHPEDKHGIIITHLFAKRVASDFTSYYINTLDLVNGKKILIENNNAQTMEEAFQLKHFHNYDVIKARRDKALRIGDLEVAFSASPDDKLEKGQFRLYFHVNLLNWFSDLTERSSNKRRMIWDVFKDEYLSWTPDGDTHDHILDSIGQYLIKAKPWSKRMPKVIGSSRRSMNWT
jgi:hypothetical protein